MALKCLSAWFVTASSQTDIERKMVKYTSFAKGIYNAPQWFGYGNVYLTTKKTNMIKVRKQNEEEKLIHGENFPVTLIIGDTIKYLTEKAFNELKTELNKFAIPDVVGRSEQLKAFLLYIQENAPNYRTKQLKPDQVIKAYLESL